MPIAGATRRPRRPRAANRSAIPTSVHAVDAGMPMRPGATVAVPPHGRSNSSSPSIPKFAPVTCSARVAPAMRVVIAPKARTSPRRPRTIARMPAPAAIAHRHVLGWIEIPWRSQSVRLRTPSAQPKNDTSPPASA
jgi:hypothetical protein